MSRFICKGAMIGDSDELRRKTHENKVLFQDSINAYGENNTREKFRIKFLSCFSDDDTLVITHLPKGQIALINVSMNSVLATSSCLCEYFYHGKCNGFIGLYLNPEDVPDWAKEKMDA